jgi:hypothetical protein
VRLFEKLSEVGEYRCHASIFQKIRLKNVRLLLLTIPFHVMDLAGKTHGLRMPEVARFVAYLRLYDCKGKNLAVETKPRPLGEANMARAGQVLLL